MAEDFERARALFKKADGDGRTLHEHLTQLLLQVAKEQPENPLAVFEELSVKLKTGALTLPRLKETPVVAGDAERKLLLTAVNKTARLLAPERDEEEAGAVEDLPVPDLMQEAELLQLAGINIGQEETYLLLLSVQQLVQEQELEEARFFGKFLGTQGDYYVVESKPAHWPEEAEDPDPIAESKREPWGEGVNIFAYYAANSVHGPWTRLPALRPEWVAIARQTRRFLTGDLNAPVLGFPRFSWGEAAYLRTQIARIAASTVVSPRGQYAQSADSDFVATDNEDYEALTPSQLEDLDNWAHHRAHLLRQGRVSPWEAPEKDEDEEEADKAEEPEEPEEPVKILSSLVEDEGVAKDVPAWTVRVSHHGGIASRHSAVSVLSVTWPGAVTVAKGKHTVNVYVGWGQKYLGGQTYTPPPPPPVQSEYVARFDVEAGEKDPLQEQEDPLPPEDYEAKERGEGDEEEDEELEEEDEEGRDEEEEGEEDDE